MTGWSVFFWLIITFLLLYPLNRWISTHVQGVAFLFTGSSHVAVWFFWVLFLPGTLLHEVSHWLMAKLLGVKTKGMSLWPKKKPGGELQMGAVEVLVSDPFRHSLIGLAPLLTGSAAVLLIGYGWLGLGEVGQALVSGDLPLIGAAMSKTMVVPDVWLWFYLVFAISNAMLPSASDRESWLTVLIYFTLALALVAGLKLVPSVPKSLQETGLTILTYLLVAFALTLAIDLLVVALLFVIEVLFAVILGRRVMYGQ
jgi:hypothetical protein